MENLKIEIPECNKDKYVLCSTLKHGYAYNSLLFWGKNSCGHRPSLTTCQLYTKDEAFNLASNDTIPIKLTDLVEKMVIHAEHASEILEKSKREYLTNASKD